MPPRALGFDALLLVTQFDTLLTTLNETRGMVYKARFCLTSGPNGIFYTVQVIILDSVKTFWWSLLTALGMIKVILPFILNQQA